MGSSTSDQHDDFTVNFKNETKLRELSQAAQERCIYCQVVGN